MPAIASFVDDVRAKAPDAEIVLVGYLRDPADSSTCPAVGIPAAETAAVVDAEELLDSSLAEAAGQADIEYVSLRAMSSGHDAVRRRPSLDQWRGTR
ncbi:hypothetical protein [Aeromicrobium sp. UC242_57]|uniref:hypothetical protein n=1 Tax=Aeromicrobium sp. UC242_57 TaxID=3374624 RepID=UPI0037AE1D1A